MQILYINVKKHINSIIRIIRRQVYDKAMLHELDVSETSSICGMNKSIGGNFSRYDEK